MKRLPVAFALSLLIFASCASTKKLAGTSAVQDGKSFETAVITTETHERQGVDAEYAWIKVKYPGAKTQGQALSSHDKKPYDIIHIITSEGTKLDVYFDISSFFGKF